MSAVHELSSVDVNLLVAFDALATERSVTKAAQRAGVTQSAMSHTLRRLRALFDDELLVRGGRGMVLTPRAEGLVVPVRSGLTSLARALATPDVFEPSVAARAFRIVSPDLFDVLALPGLLRRIEAEAPGVDIAVVPQPANLPAALETGEIDLAVMPVLLHGEDDTSPTLLRRTLFRDRLRCFFREDHPRLRGVKRMTMTRYLAEAHALVSPTGSGPGVVDLFLEKERRIALRVPSFSVALSIVAESDLLLTAPSGLGHVSTGVTALKPPLSLPEHAVTMVWHPRFGGDQAHRWLRDVIVSTTRALVS